MICSLTDSERQQGILCRSIDCDECPKYRKNYARFIKIGNKEVAVKDEMKEVLSVWLGACSIPSAPGQSCKTCAFKESCKKVKEELGL